MALTVFLVGGVLIAGLIYVLPLLYKYLKNRHRFITLIEKIPGPTAIPIFGNALQFKLDRVAFSYQLEDLAIEYGQTYGVFRLWVGNRPLVILTRAETAEPVLTSNTLITKSVNYDILKPWLATGLLTSTGEKWRSRRKMLTPTFHFSILNSFLEVVNQQASILIDQLRPRAKEQLPFDLFPYIGRCALDIICETAMGTNVSAQTNSNSEYVRAVQTISEIIFKYERMPWLWVKPIWYLSGFGTAYDKCLDLLKGFTKKVIMDRSAQLRREAKEKGVPLAALKPEDRKKQAFLDLLLLMQEEHRLTFEDIAEEVDTFMFEGHDTTSNGMGWTLFLLGHHPEVQDKIREEMDSIFGDSDRMPTPEDLKAMHYLDLVIKEGLRLYPPVPIYAREATEDFYTGGHVIPKGAAVLVIPFMMHRDAENFGPDADKFVPERFGADRMGQRHPYGYIPFSAGPRNCIGQKFAIMEEKVLLSTVMRHYRVESMERIDAVRPVPDVILRPPDKFLMRLHLRDK